jgi:hypothetical protein
MNIPASGPGSYEEGSDFREPAPMVAGLRRRAVAKADFAQRLTATLADCQWTKKTEPLAGISARATSDNLGMYDP